MTHLLVSVRDADEARIACNNGATIVDVKEPNRGSLGRADWSTIDDVVTTVRSCKTPVPISVALGELAEDERTATTNGGHGFDGITFAKLGLANAPNDWQQRWKIAMQTLPVQTMRVAVIYADWEVANSPEPSEIIAFAAQCDCRVVLMDTYCKSNGGLLDVLPTNEVRKLIQQIRDRRMMSAMAGSLNHAAIATLLPWSPDIIAVRGAVCCGERTTEIKSEKVQDLASLVASNSTPTALS